MAKLAIKGHPTRGKEVVEILEMLGGSNLFRHIGNNPPAVYYIDEKYKKFIFCADAKAVRDCIIFTLEEFLEKFPYKVGDGVIYENRRREITKMVWEEQTDTVAYKLDDKLYCNVINELQPYKKETMEDKLMPRIDLAGYCKDKYIIDLGNYEIKQENGKTYAVRKQPKYPQTCEECLNVLSKTMRSLDNMNGYKFGALMHLQQLLICRDAYWKISGEQMGLGKPWEPDWNSTESKYVIYTSRDEIVQGENLHTNSILAFPTEEMRDAFYENFKDLIEKCKEFL